MFRTPSLTSTHSSHAKCYRSSRVMAPSDVKRENCPVHIRSCHTPRLQRCIMRDFRDKAMGGCFGCVHVHLVSDIARHMKGFSCGRSALLQTAVHIIRPDNQVLQLRCTRGQALQKKALAIYGSPVTF